jgi:hypothetical protein
MVTNEGICLQELSLLQEALRRQRRRVGDGGSRRHRPLVVRFQGTLDVTA